MMVNRRRGEVTATLDGNDYRLCLTLGALAELETAFEAQDINMLIERFSSGRLGAEDMVAIIGAGLRGGGNDISDAQARNMQCEDGAVGFARIIAELLSLTFGKPTQAEGTENPQ